MGFLLPSYAQIEADSKESFMQQNPINSGYSPRLFGAPPQLTSLCDMRLLGSKDGFSGAVGDFYMEDVLKNAQIANFSVGRALFTGGFNSFIAMAMNLVAYAYAYSKYGIHGNTATDTPATSVQGDALKELAQKFYERSIELDNASTSTQATSEDELKAQEQLNELLGGGLVDTTTDTTTGDTQFTQQEIQNTQTVENEVTEDGTVQPTTSMEQISMGELEESLGSNFQGMGNTGLEDQGTFLDISSIEELTSFVETAFGNIGTALREGGATLGASLLSSLLVNQPFYTFEPDWYTYINNVKMMINSAITMLGLQSAYVRIGNQFQCISDSPNYEKGGVGDLWTNYRYITPDEKGVTTYTSIDNLKGETSQYVSFMIDPAQESESYTNTVGPSEIYSSVINKGSAIGTEIAFITNSSQSAIDDNVIALAGSTVNVAQRVLGSLTGGVGKFTAAVAAGMAKSFTGDHTIYPEIFKEHTSTQSFLIHVKLRASRGDPYTYLIDVLVPLFHILGMVLPKMTKNSAASYQYPPIVQCNVPGIWGTRLGIVESVSVAKNPEGDGVSINGYPMSLNVDIQVKDLMHTLVTTPMNSPALFLNNYTMFDYIAQITGVDKYRVNSAVRIITKIALAATFADNIFYNIRDSIANDITSFGNKWFTRLG